MEKVLNKGNISIMKKILMPVIAVMLLLCFAFYGFAEGASPVFASDQPGAYEYTGEGSYDSELNYSDKDSADTITVTASELLGLFGIEDASSAELEYLDRACSMSLYYSAHIPSDKVNVLRPYLSAALYVYAEPYTDTETENGVFVTWIPTSVTLGEQTASFSSCDTEGEYSYLATLDAGEQEDLKITYEASFAFSPELINALMNFTYNSALCAVQHIADEDELFEQLNADYVSKSALFAAYTAYTSQLAAFNAYKDECKSIQDGYDQQMQEYEEYKAYYYSVTVPEYEEAYADFLVESEAFEYYSEYTLPKFTEESNAYTAYINALRKYNEVELPEYNYYKENAPKYDAHLDIIRLAKKPMTDDRTLYGAIMGDSVTQVLQRKEELKALGVNMDVVYLADESTDYLREFFENFFSMTDPSEQYDYYAEEYNSLKGYSKCLLQALDYLYNYGGVKGEVFKKITDEEKGKKYVILLAQLYIFADALSEEAVLTYDRTATFTDTYTWTYALNETDRKNGSFISANPIAILEGERYLSASISAVPYAVGSYPPYREEPEEPAEVSKPDDIVHLTEPTEPYLEPLLDPPDDPVFPPEVQEPDYVAFADDPGDPPTPYVPTEDELMLTSGLADGTIIGRQERESGISVTRKTQLCKKTNPEDGAVVYFYPSKDALTPLYVTSTQEGSSAVFSGKIPEKPEDEGYYYSFRSWAYIESGEDAELSALGTGHIYLYPEYKAHDVNSTYSVCWRIGDEAYYDYYSPGDIPDFGSVPESYKEERESCVYFFSHWDKTPEPISENTVYTAVFTPIRYHVISWLVGGELFASTECLETELPTPPSEVPTLPDDESYRYVFSGWEGEMKKPDAPMSFEASFDLLSFYDIKWLLNGELLAESRCLEGTIPVCPLENGTVLFDDGDVCFVLNGWDRELEKPVSDTSYEAEYTTLHYYTVSWLVRGEEYFSESCLENALPTPPSPPLAYDEGDFMYSFTGWDKELSYPSSSGEDNVYTALFEGTRYYTVTWMHGESTFKTERLLEGAVPDFGDEPPKIPNGSLYKYIFISWSEEPSAVFGDTVYEAVFKGEYIHPCGVGGVEFSYSYGTVLADISNCQTDELSELALLMSLAAGKRLIVKTSVGSVTFEKDASARISELGVYKLSMLSPRAGDECYCLSLEFEDGTPFTDFELCAEFIIEEKIAQIIKAIEEKEISSTAYKLALFRKDGEYEIEKSENVAFGGGKQSIVLKAYAGGTYYKYVEIYDVSVLPEISDWLSAKPIGAAGEPVEFTLSLPEGMRLNSMHYIIEGGDELVLVNAAEGFVMPSGNIKLVADLKPIEFSIKFVLYGGSVIEKICTWGATPTPPVVPKRSDALNTYTFSGWDREIAAAFEDGIYYAQYDLTPIADAGYEYGFWYLFLLNVYRQRKLLIVSAIVSLVSAGAFTALRIYRKKHPIS